jgi:hypothetical protein
VRRAFNILFALYFPALFALLFRFYPDLRPDALEDPAVKGLALLWLADGVGLLALALALLKRQLRLPSGGRSLPLAGLLLAGALLGLPPAYLALDLAFKLAGLLTKI